jgi:hypothetical protein
MFRTHHLVAAIGLPFLLAGCGEDSAPPSGPRTEPALRPTTRVPAAVVDRFRLQIRQLAANAFGSTTDPSGCVETFVFVFGAEQTQKEGPGKPITGPLAAVIVQEINFCTFEFLRDIFGLTNDATFQGSRNLTEARLQATIPAFDFVNEVEVQAVLDLAWTGAGNFFSESDRFRVKAPGFLLSQWFRATFRPAEVSGTAFVGGENVMTGLLSAEILRARDGVFELVRTRGDSGSSAEHKGSLSE